MLPKITPTLTSAWKKLKEHHLKNNSVTINELFQEDDTRFDKFSIEFKDFLFDFSKKNASEETLELLRELGKQLSTSKLTAIKNKQNTNTFDGSSNGLLAKTLEWKN